MKRIAASILGKEKKIDLINRLIDYGISTIHYDVMDGNFVPNKSLPLEEVKDIFQNTKNHYKDVHLMVSKPNEYVDKIISFADQVSVHYESFNSQEDFEKFIKHQDSKKIGVAINPETNINILENVINFVNHIMIMSVVPGKGGQTFIENSIYKIQDLNNLIKKKNASIVLEIDGGINDIWGPRVFEEGINIAVSGSYLINNLENNGIKKILGENKNR